MSQPAGEPRRPYAPQPGDGWVECGCGQRHWGLNGAAGLLLAAGGQDDAPLQVALQHRALWTHHGGTWGIPGGARQPAESAAQAAVREAVEEAGLDAGDVEVLSQGVLEHPDWSYTTVIGRTKTGLPIPVYPSDPESLEIRWVNVAQVASLPLLPAFAEAWPALRAELTALVSSP